MKFCPHCKTGFPDQAETCPTHGILLNEIIDLKPGMLIRNTYRIVRKLGEGGMGAVYLADQTLMDEPRAIKFLARQWSRDEAFTARFRREVRTLRPRLRAAAAPSRISRSLFLQIRSVFMLSTRFAASL